MDNGLPRYVVEASGVLAETQGVTALAVGE